jgi:hypothetical protein
MCSAGDITAGAANIEGRKAETLKVFLKHPKEERLSAGVVIETGDFMCPIKVSQELAEGQAGRTVQSRCLILAQGRKELHGDRFSTRRASSGPSRTRGRLQRWFRNINKLNLLQVTALQRPVLPWWMAPVTTTAREQKATRHRTKPPRPD